MAYGLTKSAHLVSASSQFFTAGTLTFSSAWTLETWIKLVSVSVFCSPMSVQDGAGSQNIANILVDDGSAGKFGGQVSNTTGGNVKEIFSSGSISDNTWVHIAVTWDGSTLATILNGVADNTLAASLTRNSSSGTFHLGSYYDGSNSVNGQMSLARVWSVARSAAQISADMCNVLGATTGLVAEWTLDNTTADNTGNGHTLTGSGTPTFTTDTPSTCSVSGPANLKSYDGNLKANIKSMDGNLIANVKSFDGNS